MNGGGTKDFFFLLWISRNCASPFRLVWGVGRKRVRIHTCACVERHASARVRSAIVIKGDANWWQSEVRPKDRARRPRTFPVFVPLFCFPIYVRHCVLAEVPEIPDISRT